MYLTTSVVTLALLATSTLAAPRISSRANNTVNPNAVSGTTCNDPNVSLNTHDTNVAILSICGGIAGSIEKCEGNPTSTTGASGTSKFTLNPLVSGATLNVSKGDGRGVFARQMRSVPPEPIRVLVSEELVKGKVSRLHWGRTTR